MFLSDSLKANELSVQQLRSFCLVFERQSYSAAAAEIGLSVPTVWDQVRALSRSYATTLFEKRGRRIFPTPTAELLYESLKPLLAGLDSTFELVGEGDSRPLTMTLIVGARMMLEELGPPMKRFRDRYPGVCLRLMHGDNKTAEQLLVEGEADLALTLEPGLGHTGQGICYERAYEIDYLALIPEDHPLSRNKTIRLLDLVEHPLILGNRGTYGRHLLEQALHKERLMDRMRIAIETPNSAITIACVRAGMGVGVVAGDPENWLTRGLISRSLRRHLGRASIVFMWKSGRQLTQAMHSFMKEVSQINKK